MSSVVSVAGPILCAILLGRSYRGLLRRWRRKRVRAGAGPVGAAAPRRSSHGLAAPVRDVTQGDAETGRLIAHAGAGEWEPIREALSAVTDQARLTRLVHSVAGVEGVEGWLEPVLAADPEAPLPLLLSGARQLQWGWEARTGSRAKDVSQEQWKLFHERLELGEERLYRAAELRPEWHAPWYFLQTIARGLSFGPGPARHRYEAALRRTPDHLDTDRDRLQQLCRKWSGSHETMHAFARERGMSAPPGSVLPVLVADAHLEHWLDLEGEEQRRYFDDPAVAKELLEAAERSVLHPEPLPSPDWISARSTFACALSLAKQWEPARQLFRELDGRYGRYGWGYLKGGAPEAYARMRDRAFDAAA